MDTMEPYSTEQLCDLVHRELRRVLSAPWRVERVGVSSWRVLAPSGWLDDSAPDYSYEVSVREHLVIVTHSLHSFGALRLAMCFQPATIIDPHGLRFVGFELGEAFVELFKTHKPNRTGFD